MDVAGLLLTGGASRRLGCDKATLAVAGGVTLAERTARSLAGATGPAGPLLELGPGASGLRHLDDPPGPPAGPLVAVARGVATLRAEGWAGPALVVATDLPRLEPPLLAWLAAHPFPGTVVPVAGARAQWLCGRYSAVSLDAAAGLVAAGHRAIRDLADAGPTLLVPPATWLAHAGGGDLDDLDLPADLARLRAAVTGEQPR